MRMRQLGTFWSSLCCLDCFRVFEVHSKVRDRHLTAPVGAGLVLVSKGEGPFNSLFKASFVSHQGSPA